MEEQWGRLSRANGSYKPDAPEDLRRSSYLKWRQWLLDTDSANRLGNQEKEVTHSR
jgi:hypothetical protein